MRPYPPLATLVAAASLRQEGYSVALFDPTFARGEEEFGEALQRNRPGFVVLYEDYFNFLVKMCLSRMREAARRMIGMARAAGAAVIAAGPDVTDHPGPYIEAGVQYALIGEADHTLRELLDALTGRQPCRRLADISGLAFSGSGGTVSFTARRAPERHPDVFPAPAWDLLDVERYRKAWTQTHGRFSVNLVTTRGCPYHCNWCAKPIWGQSYAMRSPAHVAEEMAQVKRLLRPDHVWFADDIFGLRPHWVGEFAREVTARDAVIPFTIQSRADRMTEAAVSALARAGCVEVWLGAESGSQKVLDTMDKGITVAEIAGARSRLRAAGIRACFFLQFGYPGETYEDIMATVQMVRDNLPDDIGISVSYPLPGTRFYDMVREQLGAKTHWVDSGDLAMMFRGTYRSSFYRHLHRTLHRDLDLRRNLAYAGGIPDEATLGCWTDLEAEWRELERLERECRNAAPTRLPLRTRRIAAPDLSRGWN